MRTKKLTVTITKTKQIIHAYIPLLLLFLLPHSFTTVVISLGYAVFLGYFYLKKAESGYPSIYWEYYMVNTLVSLIFLGGYVNEL